MKTFKKFILKWNLNGIKASLARKRMRRSLNIPYSIKRNSSDLEKYVDACFASVEKETSKSNYFSPYINNTTNNIEHPITSVAFYLPQFHPIPENNTWWGSGFTEWTNVVKARPQFIDHYQPHLPGELGIYDLRIADVLHQQANLAKNFGIQGFCFHYYWFDGKRLLEKPIDLFIQNNVDLKFCFCWANENWTRRWDGLDNEVLISQNHSPDDDIAFIDSMIPAFQDKRYIKIDNKPIIIIYRPTKLPDAKATAERWRNYIKEKGFEGLYIIAAQSIEKINPCIYNYDAAVEFPPHQTFPTDITHKVKIINKKYNGRVYDYKSIIEKFGLKTSTEYTLFKTVMPSWDNEARKPGKGHSFINNTPEEYSKWLKHAIDITLKHRPEERLLFINAWNEWGEGAHLEPDARNGYAYLQATAAQLSNANRSDVLNDYIAYSNSSFKPRKSIAIIYHSFYDDLIDEVIGNQLQCTVNVADYIISLKSDSNIATVKKIQSMLPNCYFIAAENRGRDVRPFILSLKIAKKFNYTIICKIHSKKSPHQLIGNDQRRNLIQSLIGSEARILNIISAFEENGRVSLIAPDKSLTRLDNYPLVKNNTAWLDKILNALKENDQIGKYAFSFPAGTMFWCKTSAIAQLLDETIFSVDYFEPECGQLDGTFAHAIERIIGLLAIKQGEIIEMNKLIQE